MLNQLTRLREQKNVSQAELARIVGVSRQSISAIESDKQDPSLSLALKIAQVLDLRLNQVFFIEETPMQTLKTTTLTKWERLNFANQYKILKEAHKDDEYLAKYYERLEDIFNRGYVDLYSEALDEIREELPTHISNEVVDILLMHRALLSSLGQTPDPADVERVKFKGFDHLHEANYLGYAKFYVSDGENFQELRVFNSHCPTLPRYRKMLAEWNKLDRNMQLSKEQIEAILEAGTFRHNN